MDISGSEGKITQGKEQFWYAVLLATLVILLGWKSYRIRQIEERFEGYKAQMQLNFVNPAIDTIHLQQEVIARYQGTIHQEMEKVAYSLGDVRALQSTVTDLRLDNGGKVANARSVANEMTEALDVVAARNKSLIEQLNGAGKILDLDAFRAVIFLESDADLVKARAEVEGLKAENLQLRQKNIQMNDKLAEYLVESIVDLNLEQSTPPTE